MAFIQAIIKNPTRSLRMADKATGTVTTQNTVLMYASGLAVEADSTVTPTTLIGVCNQSIAAADALLQVPVIEAFKHDVWIADCTNNSNVLHDGQLMVLTDSANVNNTGTTSASGVVKQVGVYGAAANKKLLVEFV